MANMSRGVLADGMTTTLSGLAGSLGMNIVASSIAISASIGVQSRVIAYVIAGICVLLAFFPYSTLVLTTVPSAVIAVTVLMLGSFIMVSGLQLIVSRLLDVRRTLVVGMAIAAALLIEIVPSVANMVPPVLRPFLSSSLGFGTVIALIFNLVFRLGTKRKLVLAIEPANYTPTAIEDFFNINGAQWGARPDVIRRASFGTNQAVESLIENCELRDNVKLNTSFDEFNLDVFLSWHGLALDLPDQRPSNKEIMESDDGPRRLAGYLLRRNADRATFAQRGEECVLHFHFDH
jgi:NCS2 family nucleobase:cation symporter-2